MLLKSLPRSLVEAPLNLSIHINCDLHFLLMQGIRPSGTGHRGIFALTFSLQSFRSWNFYEVKLKSWGSFSQNFTSRCAIFLEILSVGVRVFPGSWNSSQRSDLGKIVITLSLSIRLEFHKNQKMVHSLYFFLYQFQSQMNKSDTWHAIQVHSAEIVHN